SPPGRAEIAQMVRAARPGPAPGGRRRGAGGSIAAGPRGGHLGPGLVPLRPRSLAPLLPAEPGRQGSPGEAGLLVGLWAAAAPGLLGGGDPRPDRRPREPIAGRSIPRGGGPVAPREPRPHRRRHTGAVEAPGGPGR